MAGDDEGDLSARLRRLDTQLARTAPPPASGGGPPRAPGGPSPLGQAMRLSSEFIGGVVVGGALGWVFDFFLGTKPWGLMAFLMLGFVTGVYNVMRVSGFLGSGAGTDAGTDASTNARTNAGKNGTRGS